MMFGVTVALLLAVSGVCQAQPLEWMAMFSNRTLREVTLPGTHDAGSYHLSDRLQPGDSASPALDELIHVAEDLGVPVEDVITPWGEAQAQTLYQQLSGGIRYIDFRCGYNGSVWTTFHFEQGFPCHTLLTDIRRFLDESSNDPVVIEISHSTGNSVSSTEQLALVSMVTSVLGPYLLPYSSSLPTIGEMAQSGKRALVTVAVNVPVGPSLWPGSFIVNSYADSADLPTMIKYNTQKVSEFQSFSGSGLYKISWTLTPDAKAVLGGVIPGHPHTLQELADTATSALVTFAAAHMATQTPLAHIVIIDHWETSDIISVCANSSTLSFPTK